MQCMKLDWIFNQIYRNNYKNVLGTIGVTISFVLDCFWKLMSNLTEKNDNYVEDYPYFGRGMLEYFSEVS